MRDAKHTPELMDAEACRQAVREGGFKVTPWRLGREMGRRYHAAFWAWSDAARAARDFTGRPERPACPYTNRASAQTWLEGFALESKKPRPAAAPAEAC